MRCMYSYRPAYGSYDNWRPRTSKLRISVRASESNSRGTQVPYRYSPVSSHQQETLSYWYEYRYQSRCAYTYSYLSAMASKQLVRFPGCDVFGPWTRRQHHNLLSGLPIHYKNMTQTQNYSREAHIYLQFHIGLSGCKGQGKCPLLLSSRQQ
eukprot:scaffold366884_cov38-Prasinocladus_malaysianus.AAC.1